MKAPTLHRVSPKRTVPTVLAIAGSDSGGGAGIQADLKAFAWCGVHGTTAITALTAQNTVGVTGVLGVPAEFIEEQVVAVATDIGVDAVKTGMLADAVTVAAVSRAFDGLRTGTPLVVDPVMVAESGAVLLDESARTALVELLLPRATVITPNVPEARVLVGDSVDPDDHEALVRALHGLGPGAVVLTGGHRDEIVDLFFDGATLTEITGARHPDGAAHGSGCTHASALAAHMALGFSLLDAARAAREIASEAIRNGLRGLGAGAGPVDVIGLAGRRAALLADPRSDSWRPAPASAAQARGIIAG